LKTLRQATTLGWNYVGVAGTLHGLQFRPDKARRGELLHLTIDWMTAILTNPLHVRAFTYHSPNQFSTFQQ